MKNTARYLLAGLVLLPAFASCEVLEPVFDPVINALFPPKEPTVFKVDGKTLAGAMNTGLTFDVDCDISFTAQLENTEWATVASVDLKKDKTGGSVKLSFPANTAEDSRAGTLVLKSGSKEIRKEFKQFGLTDFFSPRQIDLSVVNQASLSFESTKPWTARITSGEDWFGIDKDSGVPGMATIIFQSKTINVDVGPREGAVEITIDGNRLNVPVIQGQTDFIFAGADIELEYDRCEIAVPTSFNVPYDIAVSADWIHHISTKAPYEATEMFLVDENPGENIRTCVITFTGKDNSEAVTKLTVAQKGLENVFRHNTPGLYGINGANYLFGEGGWNHRARAKRKDGSLVYRFMNPAELSIFTVSGIDPEAQAGTVCQLHVVRRDKADVTMITDYEATVAGSDDTLIRLKVSGDTFFIIQK